MLNIQVTGKFSFIVFVVRFMCIRLLSKMSTYIQNSVQNSVTKVTNVMKSSSALGNSSDRCLGLREVEIFLRDGKLDCHLHFSSNYHNAYWQRCVVAASAPFRLRFLALAARTKKKLRARSRSNSLALATLTWFGGPRGVASPGRRFWMFDETSFLDSEMSKTRKYSFLLYCASTEYSRLL